MRVCIYSIWVGDIHNNVNADMSVFESSLLKHPSLLHAVEKSASDGVPTAATMTSLAPFTNMV